MSVILTHVTATAEAYGQKRAVIYVRESLDKWGDARAVERFEAACRQLCERRGLRIIRILRDNDVRASKGNKGRGYAETLRMMRARETDYVVVPVVDRFVRDMRDLEDIIDICEQTGVVVLATSGDIDLSHDQGRLVGRILASVAKGEMERKGKRQKDAAEQAAKMGARRTGCPRSFGYDDDRVSVRAGEADAIRWATDALLGGSTVSAVMREWNARGLITPQGGKPFTRQSVKTIMRNPALAALATYRGEILGPGQWEPVLTEPQWRAVTALLDDPARKPPRGAYTLLGGLAVCRCENKIGASVNATRKHVYRCNPLLRGDAAGPHSQQLVSNVDPYVEEMIITRLSRSDVAELIAPPALVDTVGLRSEAASIRTNLDEMAADRALGLLTRTQMLKATERGTTRLEEIAEALRLSASESALAPFAAGEPAAEVWAGLDRARKRATINALCEVVIYPAGRGARVFDRTTVQIQWKRPASGRLADQTTESPWPSR